MNECLFCAIAQKKVGAEIVYEDNAVVAILDINPRTLGHTMVLPKAHIDSFRTLPKEKITPIFAAVQQVAQRIDRALSPDAFTIGINEGEVAGQVIAHLHIHILPRWKNDGGTSIHSVVNHPPDTSLSEVAEKIRKYKNNS